MTTDSSTAKQPDTIVLVHGLWVTPRSWEHWVRYYEDKGYRVLAPAYPGFEVEVEALREDTSPIANSTVTGIVNHLSEIIEALDSPPILIGHSFGGTLVQLLLDRGFGVSGVAINSAPTEGVLVAPPSQLKSLFPVLSNIANRHGALPFTQEQFHYAFTNTLSKEDGIAAYNRYAIAAPGNIVWLAILGNITPGHQEAYVNYKNDDRAPLLFIASSADHIMPPAVNKSNAHHYHGSKAITDYHEFEGRSHYTVGEPGWEAVADYALDWAVKHATTPAA
jgi:pimeloyl-ACP methyl ester carboxylesterase